MTNSLRIIKRIICPKTPRANLGILYGENLSEPFNNLEAHTMTKTIRIIKKAECSKLLSTATGPLTYHVGCDDSDDSLHLRVTGNLGGGFFSNEWIAFPEILKRIQLPVAQKGFKAHLLKDLYVALGANNHGFLVAAMRSEGIVKPLKDTSLSSVSADPDGFVYAMKELADTGVDLFDDVAEANRIRDEKRAALIEQLKKKSKTTQADTSKSELESIASSKPTKASRSKSS